MNYGLNWPRTPTLCKASFAASDEGDCGGRTCVRRRFELQQNAARACGALHLVMCYTNNTVRRAHYARRVSSLDLGRLVPRAASLFQVASRAMRSSHVWTNWIDTIFNVSLRVLWSWLNQYLSTAIIKYRELQPPVDTHVASDVTVASSSEHAPSEPSKAGLAFVLDDEVQIGTLVCRVLTACGFEPRHFTSAARFITGLKTTSPDLVALDLALGPADATDVIRHLETLKYKGKVVLIGGDEFDACRGHTDRQAGRPRDAASAQEAVPRQRSQGEVGRTGKRTPAPK